MLVEGHFQSTFEPKLALQVKRDKYRGEAACSCLVEGNQSAGRGLYQFATHCLCGPAVHTAVCMSTHAQPPWLWASVTNLIHHPEGRSRRQEGEGTAGENGCQYLTRYLSIPTSGRKNHGFQNGQVFLCEMFSPLRNLEPEVYALQV